MGQNVSDILFKLQRPPVVGNLLFKRYEFKSFRTHKSHTKLEILTIETKGYHIDKIFIANFEHIEDKMSHFDQVLH